MTFNWESYKDPAALEALRQAFPNCPPSLEKAYQVGDAPFLGDENGNMPAYDIPGVKDQFGFCLNFLQIADPNAADSIAQARNYFPALAVQGYLPIATDGGGEYLMLKATAPEENAIWHFAPSHRLDAQQSLFRLADNFDEFLTQIRYVPE